MFFSFWALKPGEVLQTIGFRPKLAFLNVVSGPTGLFVEMLVSRKKAIPERIMLTRINRPWCPWFSGHSGTPPPISRMGI